MTDRTKDTYKEVSNQLLICKPDLDPKSIQIDFEQAFISAFKDIFPNAKINGCFFHFCQCVWRKIQSLGLQKMYSENSTFALQVKQLCALAFVPVHDVVYAFEELIESEYYIENKSLFQPILNYFEDTWIGRPVRRKRRSPIFPLNIWNVYENVLMKRPRTNNAVEGWHNAFNSSIGVHHTTIWKFINFIKTEQNLVEAKIEKINLGESHALKRKKYKDLDQRLENVVLNYQRGDILNYLKGIAHNFNF